jgi:outer membrane immunogenic protein
MKSILLAGLAVFTLTGAAIAADVVVQEPVAAYNWSGVYVGAQIGYAWGKSHFVDEDDDRIDYDPRGAFGGIYAGYNYEFANGVVLGVDADANFSGIERDAQLAFGGDSEPDPDHVANAKLRYTAAIRGRVGYAMDRFLPYIAGGVSFTELKFDPDHDATPCIFQSRPGTSSSN